MEFDFSKQVGIKISIKTKSRTFYVNIEDILYIRCDGYLSTIFPVEDKSICVAKSLREHEEELSEYGFLRVNYNTLVNPKHIHDIEIIKGRKHIKVGKQEINVSKRRAFLFNK